MSQYTPEEIEKALDFAKSIRTGGWWPLWVVETLSAASVAYAATLRQPAARGDEDVANLGANLASALKLVAHQREKIAALEAALSAQPAPERQGDAPEDRFEQFVAAAIARSPAPLRELGEYLTRVLDEDQFPTADRLLLQLATSHPAAGVGVPDGVKCFSRAISDRALGDAGWMGIEPEGMFKSPLHFDYMARSTAPSAPQGTQQGEV